MQPILFLREFFCLDSRWRAYRGRTRRLPAAGLPQDHRGERLRLPPLHAPRRARGPRSRPRRRHDPVDRPRHAGARHRPPEGPHRRRPAERLEHRVRLPVQPAGHLFGARLARIPASCPSPSGSPSATRAWPATRSTRWATADRADPPDLGAWQGGLRFANGRQRRACTRPTGCRSSCACSARTPWRSGAPRAPAAPGARADPVAPRQGRLRQPGGPLTVKNGRGYFKVRFQVSARRLRTFRFKAEDSSAASAKAVCDDSTERPRPSSGAQ